jgi:hypothetical protein
VTGLTIQQRCWNHEAREAVCRCPECGRSFCRECVTEHEARLLCASCLNSLAGRALSRRPGFRRLLPAALALAGILLSWIVFYGAGEAVILITTRMEQSAAEPGAGGSR